MTQQTSTETAPTGKEKNRHGCLTAWLVLTVAFSIIFIVLYLVGAGVSATPKAPPDWATPVLIILLVMEIVCAAALFRWKKWGFWGFCAVNLIGLVVDARLGLNLAWPAIQVLLSIVILYGVLHIGGKDKGWPQLD